MSALGQTPRVPGGDARDMGAVRAGLALRLALDEHRRPACPAWSRKRGPRRAAACGTPSRSRTPRGGRRKSPPWSQIATKRVRAVGVQEIRMREVESADVDDADDQAFAAAVGLRGADRLGAGFRAALVATGRSSLSGSAGCTNATAGLRLSCVELRDRNRRAKNVAARKYARVDGPLPASVASTWRGSR